MTVSSKAAVAVLAGGEGSRIGGGKPLIRLGGTTLVEQAFELANSWSNLAVVVLRSKDQIGSHQLPWIADAPGIAGPLAGLSAGLAWAREQDMDLLMTIPCDMPFLPKDLPDRLQEQIGGFGAAIASSSGNLHPVCGLWRTAAVDSIPDYCASGRRSLRGFAQKLGFVDVEWPVSSRDPFFNINSPADLAIAGEMLGR
jgi:molybdopterin-guanine dinucleotide biosynthesis protein A